MAIRAPSAAKPKSAGEPDTFPAAGDENDFTCESKFHSRLSRVACFQRHATPRRPQANRGACPRSYAPPFSPR